MAQTRYRLESGVAVQWPERGVILQLIGVEMADLYIYDIYVSCRNPLSWILALWRMLRRGVRPVIIAWRDPGQVR